jgi:predicted ABC-type ATPase
MTRRSDSEPRVVVLAGPNGAGKTTSAARLLRDTLAVEEFVNADAIAHGLSSFNPDEVAYLAGEVMLRRLRGLATARRTFAFETTLAGRTFAPWLRSLVASGYQFHLVFVWLPSADMAVARVRDRVRMGGHNVPENVVRRRYSAGIRNFFNLYVPLATSWQLMDNSAGGEPKLVADGIGSLVANIRLPAAWQQIQGKRASE